MMSPTISVIVPVFNAGKTLRKCIDSILCQSLTDFEILLIDDGSKDDSFSICEEYCLTDQRVRVFHKDNGGASSARNLGLAEMRGEWVTFCDSDDYVGVDWLASFYRYVGLDVDLVVQGHKLVGERMENKQISEEDIIVEAKTGCEILARKNQFGYTCLKLFRSSVINSLKLRFDTRFWLKEDELFVLSYLPLSGRIAFARECEYYYNLQSNTDKYKIAGEIEKQFDLLAEQLKVIKSSRTFYDQSYLSDMYLRRFTNKLLEKYKDEMPDCYESLRKYRNIVGKDFWQITDASLFLKIVFHFPLPICHCFLVFQSFCKDILKNE